MQNHLEGHGGDCDHVGILVIYFLQYGSSLPTSTVVDLVQQSSTCLDYIFISQPLSTMNSVPVG